MDQPYAGGQRPAELVRDRRPIGGDLVDQPGQSRGRCIVAEQMSADSIRHPEPTSQERSVRLLDHDQAAPDQRSARLQPGSGGGRHRGLPGELESQPDRGTPSTDIIVEISVQALEPAVQIRQQRDHQQFDVDLTQPGHPGEPP